MAELDRETRSDGVLYRLSDELQLKVQRKSAHRVKVTMQRKDIIIPPESGDLDTSGFREKLVGLARDRFGEVNGFADELGLVAVAFEAHMNEREEDAREDDKATNAPELVSTPYRVVNGGFVRLRNTREGEVPQRLTNFTASVEEEVVRDDGVEVRRFYRVAGKAGEKPLPTADVAASQFGTMNWVPEAWGLSARITAGQGSKDHVREAIELMSSQARRRHLYAHTGWRELPDGDHVYLHTGGAIGAEDVEVELEPGLERYALPDITGTSSDDLAAAVQTSLRFVELAPIRITAPLLAAAYLAPLSEIVVPDFVLWLWGGTGSFKSTLAALLLSHFGLFSETSLPLSFESTSNALERSLFLLKDTLDVVDDWRPAVSHGDASEMDRKAQRLLRAVGNRQGRGRMASDTTLRRSYAPRGVVLATAEALPEGPAFESAAARSLSINLLRPNVDKKRLSDMQGRRAELPRAMAGYLSWLAPRYEEHAGELPARRGALRDELRPLLAGSHPRTPDAAAALLVGFRMLLSYAVNIEAVGKSEGLELFDRAKAGIVEASKAHAETTSGGDPATRFTELLASLFDAGRVFVKDRETGKEPPDYEALGWQRHETQYEEGVSPKRNAAFVGWADETYLYLDKEAAYAAVAGFAQQGGIPFGIKPRSLWNALKRAGVSLTDEGRTDTRARVAGAQRRIVQMSRAALHQEEREA